VLSPKYPDAMEGKGGEIGEDSCRLSLELHILSERGSTFCCPTISLSNSIKTEFAVLGAVKQRKRWQNRDCGKQQQ